MGPELFDQKQRLALISSIRMTLFEHFEVEEMFDDEIQLVEVFEKAFDIKLNYQSVEFQQTMKNMLIDLYEAISFSILNEQKGENYDS